MQITPTEPEPGFWQYELFLRLVDYYRVYTGGGNFFVKWLPGLEHNATPKGQHVPFRKLTYVEFLRRLGQGLLSRGGREVYVDDNSGTPGRSGIWAERNGLWTECGARRT